METQSIPRTPPPPYQTLPPTPIPTPDQTHTVPSRTHGPSQIVPNVIYSPTFGGPPHTHHAPPYYHGNLITLPFRPIQHCVHPISYQYPVSPIYNTHHVGGHPAAPAAALPIIPRPQQQQRPWQSYLHLGSLSATLNDAGNLAVEVYDSLASSRPTREQYGGALDAVALRLDDVLTSMDDGTYIVNSTDLAMAENQAFANADATASSVTLADAPSCSSEKHHRHSRHRDHKRRPLSSTAKVNARIPGTSTNPFSKVYHYANAYTSSALPPLRLYFATWPLICLASTYSRRAYEKPSSKERQDFISGDWRRGTKTVVVKSIPLDEKNTIVLAIRGTQSFQDWAVNIRTEPTAPTNFLDDEGNLCHAGFLSVARKMIKPVAAQLRELLEENPRRATTCSLILTGHSAGGAVAALLYCHMLSQTVSSELTELQDLFKRVHCVTFGAPPISLLPLQRPTGKTRYEKNFFFAFVNEGDPVARADKTYVRSLLELYARPGPRPLSSSLKPPSSCSADSKITPTSSKGRPTWHVPEATLSLAGRIIVLRTRKYSSSSSSSSPHRSLKHQGDSKRKKTSSSSSSSSISIEAVTASDSELRGLIFGDPLMHTMDLYAQRIEQLATRAVVGSSVS